MFRNNAFGLITTTPKGKTSTGAKARLFYGGFYAALKRRSSTVLHATDDLTWRGLQGFSQPGNNNLLEEAGIGPDSDLAAEVSAVWVYPGFFGHVAFAEQEIFVVDGNLSIEHTGENEHGSHRLAQQTLLHQRQLGQEVGHFIQRLHVFEDRHQRRDLIEQIFAIAHKRAHQKIFLEKFVDRRRLRAASTKAVFFDDGHFCGPVCAPTHAVHG